MCGRRSPQARPRERRWQSRGDDAHRLRNNRGRPAPQGPPRRRHGATLGPADNWAPDRSSVTSPNVSMPNSKDFVECGHHPTATRGVPDSALMKPRSTDPMMKSALVVAAVVLATPLSAQQPYTPARYAAGSRPVFPALAGRRRSSFRRAHHRSGRRRSEGDAAPIDAAVHAGLDRCGHRLAFLPGDGRCARPGRQAAGPEAGRVQKSWSHRCSALRHC